MTDDATAFVARQAAMRKANLDELVDMARERVAAGNREYLLISPQTLVTLADEVETLRQQHSWVEGDDPDAPAEAIISLMRACVERSTPLRLKPEQIATVLTVLPSDALQSSDPYRYHHGGRYWMTLDASGWGLTMQTANSGIRQALEVMEARTGKQLRPVSVTAFHGRDARDMFLTVIAEPVVSEASGD